jgi:hypothetical protein
MPSSAAGANAAMLSGVMAECRGFKAGFEKNLDAAGQL